MPDPETTSALQDWLEAELADSLDEDLELSEPAISEEFRKLCRRTRPPFLRRREYLRALLALQAELIRLQDKT